MEKTFKNSNAVILAGGEGRRMKSDKKFLKFKKHILLEKVVSQVTVLFDNVYISISKNSDFRLPEFKTVRDIIPGKGPLMGILSGLTESDKNINFVIAADIPEINGEFISKLYSYTQDFEIVVPVSGKDKYEPLFAFYNKSIVNEIRSLIDSGTNKIIPLFFRCRTKFIQFENTGWYRNLNTPEDYNDYLKSSKID